MVVVSRWINVPLGHPAVNTFDGLMKYRYFGWVGVVDTYYFGLISKVEILKTRQGFDDLKHHSLMDCLFGFV